ncbi:Pr6Pr family membrane protein [Paractinoplanes atraurantiacus]|uniref:Pr6Pr family membrane protein n=1 Tax=Paractinoplanes atraurantiacus TaxID=1036182 RepID=UPI001FE5CCC3|nr:Pr6Pr family membrane protein [Actinoplanes atraurantiacus]
MNRVRTASRIWHGLLFAVVLTSLVIQMVLSAQGTDAPAVTRFIRLFSYFTIQSNVLVLLAAGSLMIDPGRDGRVWRVLRLDSLLGIIVTGIVYATILAGESDPHGAGWWSNLGFHYIAPWAALAGWLVFGPRPRIDLRTIGWAFLWPAAWIGYTLAHGGTTDWFPYPFTDATTVGYPAAVRNMLMVAVMAAVFAAILWFLDRRLPQTAAGGPVPVQASTAGGEKS